MDDTRVSRMNLWLVAVLVAALALFVAAAVVMLQPIVGTWIGAALHGPNQMAPICPGSLSPCP